VLLVVPLVLGNPEITQVFDGLRVSVVQNSRVAQDSPAVLRVQVFNESGARLIGSNVSCSYSAYNGTGGAVASGSMAASGTDYSATIGAGNTSGVGRYPFIVNCVGAGVGAYVNSYFVVSPEGVYNEDYTDNLSIVAVVILLPFLLAFIMLFGAATLDPEEHPALKIGLFLGSIIPFYLSVWFGLEALGHFYAATGVADALANGTSWMVISLGLVLIFYFVVFFIYKSMHMMAQQKEERLRY
jgi:hypothetical protein